MGASFVDSGTLPRESRAPCTHYLSWYPGCTGECRNVFCFLIGGYLFIPLSFLAQLRLDLFHLIKPLGCLSALPEADSAKVLAVRSSSSHGCLGTLDRL